MKRNAIIRIIIWSTVLVLLVSILGSVVAAKTYRTHHETEIQEARPHVTSPQETVVSDIGTPFETPGYIMEQVNVRSAPNQDSSAVGSLSPGDMVDIKRYELADNEKWLFIQQPVQGWILGKYVDLAPEGAVYTEPKQVSKNENSFAVAAEHVREIKIAWVAGSITIESADVDRIQVRETKPSDEKYAMVWKHSGDKLFIEFCDKDLVERPFGGVSLGKELVKDLTILLPMNFTLDSLEVDAAAATMNMKNLMIRELEFDGASGIANFENCVVDQLDIDTASGDVTFSGILKNLECDAASASVTATLDNVPKRIDMDSMSGHLDLVLPDNAGFSLKMNSMSGDFISDFGFSAKANGSYTCGDGSCQISFQSMSGRVTINKAQTAATTPSNP